MSTASKHPEILAVQMKKMESAYELLQKIMPEYFLKHVSSETMRYLLPLAIDIELKTGVQMVEAPDEIVLAYLKSEENNPVKTGRLVAGRRVRGTMIHESRPFGESGHVLIVEQITKESAVKKQKKENQNFAAVAEAYEKNGKKVSDAFVELFSRLDWNEIADLTPAKIATRMDMALTVQGSDHSEVIFEKIGPGQLRVTVGVATVARVEGYYVASLELLERHGLKVERSYLRELSCRTTPEDFDHKSTRINTFYISGFYGGVTQRNLLERELNELSWSMTSDLFESELYRKQGFDHLHMNLLRAAAEFVHSQLAFVDRNAYTATEIQRFMAIYPGILREMCNYFDKRFDPASQNAGGEHLTSRKKIEALIDRVNSGMPEKDEMVQTVLRSVLNFMVRVLKSNCYSEHKSALAFRLDPAFMEDYAAISEQYRSAFPTDRPCGVFFFWRREITGFHIRFAEISRGGWRTVVPRKNSSTLESGDNFEQARNEIFREGFVLAHTQHKKNKDIYEGGSKLATLLAPPEEYDFKTGLWAAQRGVFDAFLSLINYDEDGKLKDRRIIDCTGKSEIIEIGPDENMFDPMIEWMGERATHAGYVLGSGIISGKADTGINHKTYGVTSFGVFQYFLRTLTYLGINPAQDAFSVKVSGGPFGDVAGNFIKLLNEKTNGKYRIPNVAIVAVTDGPAAIYDPAGIDREELSRLVHTANLDGFDPNKLNGDGAYMIFNTPEVSPSGDVYRAVFRENGECVEKKIERGYFMNLFQHNICQKADIFVPCGGRPRTIDANNVGSFMLNGVPSARAIVEGANSFLTPEARNILQKQGVVIVKDASANKCGVITSSYEILSGLMLSPEEIKAEHTELVKEVMLKLELCAKREADWLFNEHTRSGVMMTELSDRLADSINSLNEQVKKVFMTKPELVTDKLIMKHLPALFHKKYADRLARLPQAYRIAIGAVEVASLLTFRGNSLEEEIKGLHL